MNNQTELKKQIISVFGSQAALARSLDIKCAMTVYQWFRPDRRVPVEHCLRISELSGGAVTLSALRPDVYPAPNKSVA